MYVCECMWRLAQSYHYTCVKKRSTQSLKVSLFFLLEVAMSILRVNLSNRVQK